MNVRIDELEQIKCQLEEIISLMDDKNEDDITPRCNTYGLYGTFISIPGKGFISLEDTIDKLMDDKNEE